MLCWCQQPAAVLPPTVLLLAIVFNRALFSLRKECRCSSHPRAMRMAKFPLGSPRQVISFLRPTDTILTRPVIKTKEWAMKQTNLIGELLYRLFLSKVLFVGNPSSLNFAKISSSLYMYLSQTLFYFPMDKHTYE